jgi:hypothetical protein
LLEAGVPDVSALARDAELVGDLGLGATLGEQLGRLEPSSLKGGTLLGRVGAAGGRHRRTLVHHQPSRQPNPRNSNSVSTNEVTAAGLICPDQMTPVPVSVVFIDVTLDGDVPDGDDHYSFGTIDP